MPPKIVVTGLGPSLKDEDIQKCLDAGCHLFAVNELYQRFPQAHWHYAADRAWWDVYGDDLVEKLQGDSFCLYADVCWKYRATHPDKVHMIAGENKTNGRGGLYREQGKIVPGYVYHGGTSVHTALSLAFHMQYTEIILLGVDLKEGHYLKKEERAPYLWKTSPYEQMKQSIKDCLTELVEAGATVYHCSPDSELDWEYIPLEEALG